MSKEIDSFCAPLGKLTPRPSLSRSYSDNERKRDKSAFVPPQKGTADLSKRRELSGNNSGVPAPKNTFIFRGKTPSFISIDKVIYRVFDEPINNGQCPSEFDAVLINVDSKQVFVAKISEVQNLSCLYFENRSAQ